jgi:hypothetical protein
LAALDEMAEKTHVMAMAGNGKVLPHPEQDVVRFIRDYYDDRDEMEKDVWHAARIPGAKFRRQLNVRNPA